MGYPQSLAETGLKDHLRTLFGSAVLMAQVLPPLPGSTTASMRLALYVSGETSSTVMESSFIAHKELMYATFDQRSEDRNQVLSHRHSFLPTGCLAVRTSGINAAGRSQMDMGLANSSAQVMIEGSRAYSECAHGPHARLN
jgi:hypothetical protein